MLAPDDKLGYPDAHYWRARYLLATRDRNQKDTVTVLHHAERAVRGNPDNAAAQELLGRLHLAAGQYDKALIHLALAADENASVRLAMAQTYRLIGSSDGTHQAKANSEAVRAAEYFTQQIQLNPDRADFRIALAQAKKLLREYADSIKILAGEVERLQISSDAEEPPTQEQAAVKAEMKDLYRQWYLAIHPKTGSTGTSSSNANLQLDAQKSRREAFSQSELASEYFIRRLRATPTNANCRIRLAELFLLHERYKDAVSIIEEGAVGNSKMLDKALINVYQQWYVHLAQDDSNVESCLTILQRLLDLDVGGRFALTQLALLSGEVKSAATDAVLKRALSQGTAPATVHLILGSNAIRDDDLEKATFHLEQAHRLNPKLATVLNNLAWALAHAETPDHSRALMLVDAALDSKPNNAEFRETRGQIFALMARWEEALADLEFALQRLGSRAGIHKTLSLVYAK
ncbi:MAG: hypothetical protein CMJ78_15805 [Planctomycetaceae bacterium]|nr:hypothetical protein [Planctomycetaceae bacterium]